MTTRKDLQEEMNRLNRKCCKNKKIKTKLDGENIRYLITPDFKY